MSCPPKFTKVTGDMLKKSLARRLIPTVDRLRDLRVGFGLRPYTVTLVVMRWQGGRRGIGPEVVVSEVEILPVPAITDLSSLRQVVTPVGLDEAGSLMISEISGSYTEEQLMGRAVDGTPPGPDESFFYEVLFPGTQSGERRRFFPTTAPAYIAGNFMWQLSVEKQAGPRGHNGEVP